MAFLVDRETAPKKSGRSADFHWVWALHLTHCARKPSVYRFDFVLVYEFAGLLGWAWLMVPKMGHLLAKWKQSTEFIVLKFSVFGHFGWQIFNRYRIDPTAKYFLPCPDSNPPLYVTCTVYVKKYAVLGNSSVPSSVGANNIHRTLCESVYIIADGHSARFCLFHPQLK